MACGERKVHAGEVLLGQNKPAEAEPLITAGYECLNQDEVALAGDCMKNAIRRLVELAAATNKPGDVKKWQAELVNYPARDPAAVPGKKLRAKIEIAGKMVMALSIDWAAYRGKIVLVGFWNTSSPKSRLEIANVKKLFQLYHDRGFDVVGVGLDGDKRELQRYLERERLPWATLYTRDAKGGNLLALACGISGVPASLLFDREGKVICHSGRGDDLASPIEKTTYRRGAVTGDRCRGDDLASLLEKLLGPPYTQKAPSPSLICEPKQPRLARCSILARCNEAGSHSWESSSKLVSIN